MASVLGKIGFLSEKPKSKSVILFQFGHTAYAQKHWTTYTLHLQELLSH